MFGKHGLALIMALSLSACRAHEARWGGGQASSFGSGAPVKAFWRAHGDPEAWKQHAGVSFSYSVESLKDAEQARFAEVSFRLDDYRHLWLRKEGEDRLTRVDLSRPLEWQGSGAIGCALHTLRYLFSVPISSARGRWEFRTLLAPNDVQTPDIFEAAPLDLTAPLGPCRLQGDPKTGLLARITYFPRHPFALGEPRDVTFESYVESGSARIALVRRSSLFREVLAGVRFFGVSEAEERLVVEDPEGPRDRQ